MAFILRKEGFGTVGVAYNTVHQHINFCNIYLYDKILTNMKNCSQYSVNLINFCGGEHKNLKRKMENKSQKHKKNYYKQ